MLPPGATQFPVAHVRRSETLQFNVHDYAHQLLGDFRLAGGRIEMREFHAPAEMAALKEKVVINCTGYGARALWRDDSIVPVRGQIGWLIPQREVDYGFFYRNVSVLSRTDGIVVQALEGGDLKGYNDDHEVVDREESLRAVAVIEALYARFRA
jgi:D-amino-acid oxidase